MQILKGKAAIITGSTSGIGLCVARALAAEGCSVLLHGLGDAQQIERQCLELRATCGVGVEFSAVDLTDLAAVPRIVEQAQAAFGRVDILVNNAGIQHVEALESFPPTVWAAMLSINLAAPLLLVRGVIPHMRKAGWGRIVNIGSTHSLVGSAYKVPYAATKHGIVGLTRGAAIELAEYGITCNAIAPGFVSTPLFRQQAEGVARQTGTSVDVVVTRQVGEKQAIDRLVEPEEIAECVRFLCSEAGRSITGVVLPVDGGWVAQ